MIIIIYVAIMYDMQVEFLYPPLAKHGSSQSTATLPSEWRFLPFLALPDGAHNCEQGTGAKVTCVTMHLFKRHRCHSPSLTHLQQASKVIFCFIFAHLYTLSDPFLPTNTMLSSSMEPCSKLYFEQQYLGDERFRSKYLVTEGYFIIIRC